MNTTEQPVSSSRQLHFAPKNKQAARLSGFEQQAAQARLQHYLTLLHFNDLERARIVEQVMSRALACDNPGRLGQNVVRELHEFFARGGRLQSTADDDAIAWSSIGCRASAWMRPDRPRQHISLMDFKERGSSRLSSVPPMQRRSMVPKQIEYFSFRGIWRSFRAWLLGNRDQAQFSLGRTAGK